MKITLYGKQGHAHTVAFKNFLRTSDVEFQYVDVLKDEKAKLHTKELYEGQLKFPTLFVDDDVYLTPSSDDFNKIMKELKLRG
ncbi:glutaredoxin family protein [Pseudotenacibaculum haliotis]|uniref:Glutaredoxin family protein n=1 Tax=Pseudotenacibaculum haliotis TaxID=1862138 RepID=A0ABW5LQC9_9FLAO